MTRALDTPQGWDRFRVTDPTAQARLVRLIKEAALPHAVANDGSLLLSRDEATEDFLCDFLDSVFPHDWYREGITDPAVADRYRRFTAQHGTVIVDETVKGQQCFVQATYEKLYRHRGVPTHVSFSILRDDLDPVLVSAQLGLIPTFACRKGERFAPPYSSKRSGTPLRPSRTGWWGIYSIPDVQSNEILPHLTWLLERLEPVADRLQEFVELKPTGGDLAEGRILRLSIVERAGPGGLDFNNDMLRRLSALFDHVHCWIWPDDYL